VQGDCIVVALGLPQLKILEQRELADSFEVTVIYGRQGAACPRCGVVTAKEQDRRLRDKTVYLVLMKRRFRCLWCGKEFTEPDEFSVRKRRLYHTVICDLVKGEVMEVVEGQGRQKVEDYLDSLPEPEKVKGVVMDMHEPFRQGVRMVPAPGESGGGQVPPDQARRWSMG
jgi:transposase